MSTFFFIAAGIFAISLVGVLVWALQGPRRRRKRAKEGLGVLRSAPQHLSSMGSIRQAFDPADLQYVKEQAGSALAKQVARERRQVAFLYLAAAGLAHVSIYISYFIYVLIPALYFLPEKKLVTEP